MALWPALGFLCWIKVHGEIPVHSRIPAVDARRPVDEMDAVIVAEIEREVFTAAVVALDARAWWSVLPVRKDVLEAGRLGRVGFVTVQQVIAVLLSKWKRSKRNVDLFLSNCWFSIASVDNLTESFQKSKEQRVSFRICQVLQGISKSCSNFWSQCPLLLSWAVLKFATQMLNETMVLDHHYVP